VSVLNTFANTFIEEMEDFYVNEIETNYACVQAQKDLSITSRDKTKVLFSSLMLFIWLKFDNILL
jgi:hypothetical protein